MVVHDLVCYCEFYLFLVFFLLLSFFQTPESVILGAASIGLTLALFVFSFSFSDASYRLRHSTCIPDKFDVVGILTCRRHFFLILAPNRHHPGCHEQPDRSERLD